MGTADRSTDELAEEIEALKRDMAAMKEDATATAATLLERGRQAALAMKESVAAGLKKGVGKSQECIEEHPFTSVLVAFGIGLVAGGLIMRRRS